MGLQSERSGGFCALVFAIINARNFPLKSALQTHKITQISACLF